MSGKPEILCVGHDLMLNRTRRMILERLFEVKIAGEVPEAISLLLERRFALVLLCYSLSEEECRAMVEFVHSLPGKTKILALAEARERLIPGPQDHELLSGGPAELLGKVASIVGVALDERGEREGAAKPSSRVFRSPEPQDGM